MELAVAQAQVAAQKEIRSEVEKAREKLDKERSSGFSF